MHTNHRRKKGRHNPRRGVGWSNRSPKRRGFTYEKRLAHKKERAEVRELLSHERYDDVPFRYHQTVLWDFW